MVPVGIFGAIGYSAVSSTLRANASERLTEASKRYGLLLNDRLIQAERGLSDLTRARSADIGELGALTATDTRLRSITLRNVPLSATELANAAPEEAASLAATLQVSGAPRPVVQMQVVLRSGVRKVFASAEIVPSELWDADAVTLAGMTLCATAAGKKLSCEGTDQGAPDHGAGEEVLREHWTLFLKPRYGAHEWTIEASQPASVALRGLHTFQITLLGAAGLACFVALLLSAIQIRRSHQPLAELIKAARQMGGKRFDTRVKVTGAGEFAQLGLAFNQLAAGLQRQFRIQRAFSRIDRQILTNAELKPVILAVLPRVPRLLRAQVAFLALQETDAGPVIKYFCTEDEGSLGESRVHAMPLLEISESPGAHWEAYSQRPVAETLHWSSAQIVVGEALRGVMAVGRTGTQGARHDEDRHLRGLARRFAVAIANEDRARALLRQAYYDSLTALPNRQLFKDRLAQDILRCTQAGARVVLFFIDLDHFKNVNDSLGHSAGDALLCAASARLQDHLRVGDTLARLGGDEFTLVAPDLDDAGAEAVARGVIQSMTQPFQLGGMQCVVQASTGIAVYPRDADSAEALLRSADTAMYRAKSQGRGRAVFFEEAMNARANRRLALEQRLRLAIGNGSLFLQYQPKFAAADRRLVGVEALARWNDGIHGQVSPAEFISLAEECGLIESLGAWCLREACRAMRGWRERGLQIGHVAVNVSMQQLRNLSFPDLVHSTLQQYDLDPADLEIEVTESMVAGDIGEVVRLLSAIRELGVRIAIDDFGTGYSSMVALQQLPADVVKIDRTFVVGSEKPQGLALLKALIAAGHALGKEVVAEGVETEAQFAILSACRCDVIQGYLLGRPQSAAEIQQAAEQAERVNAAPMSASLQRR